MLAPLPKSRPRVWIADDSPSDLERARAALETECEVAAFPDGETVLEALTQQEEPDLLVLDWTLPGISGVELCSYLCGPSSLRDVAVMIVTAHGHPTDVAQAFAAGASDLITKPYTAEVLRARARAVLTPVRLRKRAEAAERALQLQLEQERQARHHADVLAAHQRQILAIVGHDLRNPLQAITLAAHSLQNRPNADAGVLRAASRIASSAGRMGEMIRALMDFSAAELGGGLKIQPGPANLAEIIERVVDELAPATDRELRVELAERMTGTWDATRIGQVASNLLGNALKHGAPGTPVLVRSGREGEGAFLEVVNEGTPIPADKLAQLFAPFARADTRTDGLGLGLYIARTIVEAHGGHLRATSSEAGIITFHAWLPPHATA